MNNKLEKHVSPLGMWAFSVGTAIGWGSLVVTGNTYLVQAGPVGSVLGLVIGALIMLGDVTQLCISYVLLPGVWRRICIYPRGVRNRSGVPCGVVRGDDLFRYPMGKRHLAAAVFQNILRGYFLLRQALYAVRL